MRALSEHVEVEPKREILPHPLAKRIKLVAVLFGPHQPLDVLGLSAMALWWCDHVAGACVGRGRAVVTADQMESQPIVDHSIRSFLLARLLADHEGCLNDVAYDQDLLFAATVMHDLGLGEYAQGQARFEVEGADLAAGVLRNQGVAEADVDKVWEAIALHACIGIADRRGLLTYLTHRGVFMDIGRTEDPVASQLRQEVFNAYPRPAGDRSIADAIVKHAARSEAAAPRGSLAAELLLEHREAGGAV